MMLNDPTTFRSRTLSALGVPGVAVKTKRVCISSGSRTIWQYRESSPTSGWKNRFSSEC